VLRSAALAPLERPPSYGVDGKTARSRPHRDGNKRKQGDC
jgi:hypothetical protein